MLNRLPLRVVLTLPYLALLLLLAAAVGWLSYRAANDAVDGMAERLNQSIQQRIQASTGSYLANWRYALTAAAAWSDAQRQPTLADIESELWVASSLSEAAPAYVYFATPDGRFVGVQRAGQGPALLKLREHAGSSLRQLYQARQAGDRSRPQGAEPEHYDATTRPWYQAAVAASGPVWSPVYRDFSTRQPTVTLALAKRDGRSQLHGVYGADVPLAQLETFLQGLDIARQGLAYLVTSDGRVIASSLPGGAALAAAAASAPASDAADSALAAASGSSSVELAASFRAVASQLTQPDAASTRTVRCDTPSGPLLVSAGPLLGGAGVDWWVVVALKQDVLTQGIRANAVRTVVLAGLAALAVLALGALVLAGLARDIGQLTRAAERLSSDARPEPLPVARRDELGRLGHAFNRMAHRLASSTDMVRQQNESLQANVSRLGEQIKARDLADQRLRQVADSLQEGLLVVDHQWRVAFANRLAEPYAAVPLDQTTGRLLWEVAPDVAGSAVEQALRQAMADAQPATQEVPLRHGQRWLRLRLFPSEVGLAVFFSDVTEQRRQRLQVAERQEQLHQLASALLTTQTDERRAIARELHDELGQQLAALRINLQVLIDRAEKAVIRDEATLTRLRDSLGGVQQMIAQVRSRALDLHPAILDDLGLGAALQWLVERQAQRLALVLSLHGEASLPKLPPSVELAAFRIAQEAINNAARHSGASRIDVQLGISNGQLRLSVHDNGRGFEAGDPLALQRGQSLGLVSMRERAEQLGGSFTIQSHPERGTTVLVTLPLHPENPAHEQDARAAG
jgi:signal transduction histidine kinase